VGPRAVLHVMEKRTISYSCREPKPRFLGRPAHSLVGIRTELSRLHFSDSVPCDISSVISFATWMCLCKASLQPVSMRTHNC
jgi:hypothetical protein